MYFPVAPVAQETYIFQHVLTEQGLIVPVVDRMGRYAWLPATSHAGAVRVYSKLFEAPEVICLVVQGLVLLTQMLA
jgi:hypothetical protein